MKTISAEEFDRKFDDGEDISEYVDWSTATRPNLEPVAWTVTIMRGTKLRLERQAKELGVPSIPCLKTGSAKSWTRRGHPPPNNTLARFSSSRYSSSHEDQRHDLYCD